MIWTEYLIERLTVIYTKSGYLQNYQNKYIILIHLIFFV